jgi:hypothetical protein
MVKKSKWVDKSFKYLMEKQKKRIDFQANVNILNIKIKVNISGDSITQMATKDPI